MDETNRPEGRTGPRASVYAPKGGGISRGAVAAAAVLIALAIGGGYYWWQQRNRAVVPPLPTAVQEPAPAPVVEAPAPAPVAPVASAPVIEHPIEVPAATATAEAPLTLDQSEGVIMKALDALLANKAGASMVRRDDFVRRAVVTIDNLGRAHAAPRLWPVNPMAGKFTAQRDGDTEVIASANSVRYSAIIAFAESMNLVEVVALYKKHYPLFEAAYKELGYPSGAFNDRFVAVIDLLLATPEPAGPLALKLVEVKGEIASTQPWTRYEFADPKLEALPAGQKMLLRMGTDNAQRVKARLKALRGAIASAGVKK